MAECSESTGSILTPSRAASGMMMCPAQTSVSLFASAMFLPSRIAATVGSMPIMPTIPVTSVFALASVATSIRPSCPA